MKYFLVALIALASSLSVRAADPVPVSELEDNAYIRLYREWVELDKNNLERLKVVAWNEAQKLDRSEKLYPKGAITLENLQDQQTRTKLANLSVERQQMNVIESEARLSVIRSRVAAGLTDIPICIRPDANN